MSFTKGPWKVIKPRHGFKSKFKCVQIGKVECYATSELLPDDARLIAAAPRMYAAIKEYLEW